MGTTDTLATRPDTDLTVGEVVRTAAAFAIAGAGLLHLDAARDHLGHVLIAAFFVVAAVGQFAVAAGLVRRVVLPHFLPIAILLNGGLVLTWLLSRTVGLGFVPGIEGVEPVGWSDLTASGLELLAVTGLGAIVAQPIPSTLSRVSVPVGRRVLAGVAAVVVAVTLGGVLAPHTHSASHTHDDPSHAHPATGDGHPHDAGETGAHDHGDGAVPDDHAVHGLDAHGDPLDPDHAAHGTDAHGNPLGHAHSDLSGHSGDGGDHGGDHHGDEHGTGTGAGGHGGHSSAAGPAAPDPMAGPGKVTTMRVGPIPLPPNSTVIASPHTSPVIPFAGPGRVNILPLAGIPTPCRDCYVLGTKPDLVYADGSTANLDTGPMLHHAVFSDMSRTDPVCGRDTAIGQIGHRVFAIGNERSGGALPPGYGFPVDDGPWGGAVELMNMSDQPRTVYVQVAVRWVPRSTPGIRSVTPVWLDIDSCDDSEVDIGSGVTDIAWDWRSKLTGRIIAAGGHLHDGGVWLGATNRSTGQTVCNSVAGYGTNPRYLGTLESMSTCVWDRLATVRKGEVLRLNAHYNTAKAQRGVMGIMVIFVYETSDLAGGTGSPYPARPPRDTGPMDTGHQH